MDTAITLDVKQFANALKFVVKFAKNSNNYAPLLGYVHIAKEYIEYCGFNNYLKIPLRPLSITGDFSVLLNIAQLADRLKAAKDKVFTITVVSDEATLTVGGGSYKVALGNLSDWEQRALEGFSPNTADSKTSVCCNFGLIEKCLPFATVNDDTRPSLNGVFVDKANYSLVASDGFRLIAVKLETDSFKFYTSNEPLLIPSDLLKVVKGIKGEVNVIKTPYRRDVCWVTILSEESIFAWQGLSEVTTINYASLLPKAYKYDFKFDADITSMLKSATPASLLSFTGSTMLVETYDSYLNVNSKKLVGSQTVNVDVVKCPSQYLTATSPVQVGLNPKYLLDALAICQKGEYNIAINTSSTGVVDSAISVKNTSIPNEILVLVMPMGLK